MVTKRMLIDASHPEETRVVVVDGSRVEDFDVEVASRRQLKGNIYLAKVTRVEPSLQAGFVDYGGNRHGFLAFNEIHPDYYQIPIADRERLLAEQAAAERDSESDREGEDAEAEAITADEDEEVERRRARLSSRYYKIQEVIKRRQIMLVQVAKEERGNKGAALTTYLSLAGRYCVLMPNTSRGGGISRKIAEAADRKRLKKIIAELEVPEGMAVIVRTAGAGRSKAEIKRDYEYLVRLWSSIREMTLQSTAPTLVYEEASLIKRSIRDLYGRDIAEIIVQGEEEYRIAKEFMKLFISSHAKRVKLYEDTEKPLFQQFGVEEHLDSMHQPTVQLRSGGYVVINPTEALVAIDVNSGRSTRERNIEETALRTNLEAADEIARQLRLRDLAGLIVIDFIDMENARNQGTVERRLKEAMKNDRARVQIGRISPFGLLELSRQRLRPSLIETCFEVCPACNGNGLRRTTESTALAILRKLEEEGIKRRVGELAVTVPPLVAMYLLNEKRRSLVTIEGRYGLAVAITGDPELVPPDHRIDRLKPLTTKVEEEVAEVEEGEAEPALELAAASEDRDEVGKRGRRRRPRRRRRGEGDGESLEEVAAVAEAEDEAEAEEEDLGAEEPELAAEESSELPGRKRRRRGKRGGRRRARVTPEQPFEPATDAGTMLEADGAREPATLVAEADVAEVAEVADGADEEEWDEAAEGEWDEPVEIAETVEMAESAVAGNGEPDGSHAPRRRRRRRLDESSKQQAGLDTAAIDVAREDVISGNAHSETHETNSGAVSDDPRGTTYADDFETEQSPAASDDLNGERAWPIADEEPPSDEASTSPPEEAIEIIVVGGTRPALAEPAPEEMADKLEESEQAELSESTAAADGGEWSGTDDSATVDVVGEARPPLPLEESGAMAISGEPREASDIAIVEQSGVSASEELESRHEMHRSEVTQDVEAVAVPVFSSNAEAKASPPPANDAEQSEKARRTEVIRVGENAEHNGEGGSRRGWWQRLLS